VDTVNPAMLDERTQGAHDGFDFGEFRHRSEEFSRRGLQDQCVPARAGFGDVAERGSDGLAFIPI
jgi:hypothetical protein